MSNYADLHHLLGSDQVATSAERRKVQLVVCDLVPLDDVPEVLAALGLLERIPQESDPAA